MITFTYTATCYAALFVMSFIVNKEEGGDTLSDCRTVMAFDFFYWAVWLALISRASMTSYMNLQFSKELRETNRYFQMVFNESVTEIKKDI